MNNLLVGRFLNAPTIYVNVYSLALHNLFRVYDIVATSMFLFGDLQSSGETGQTGIVVSDGEQINFYS